MSSPAQYVHRYNCSQFQHDNLKLFQYTLPAACIFITPFLKSNSRAGCNQEQVTYDGARMVLNHNKEGFCSSLPFSCYSSN